MKYKTGDKVKCIDKDEPRYCQIFVIDRLGTTLDKRGRWYFIFNETGLFVGSILETSLSELSPLEKLL